MQLRGKINGLLQDVQRTLMTCVGGRPLWEDINTLTQRLNMPLRIAVVGIMKAGKSTFINALVKQNLLYTGSLETTYNVCWFKYGPAPLLTIHFRDGSSEEAPFDLLEFWTVRSKEAENPRLNDIRYIIIWFPLDILRTLELIDTPGLSSSLHRDSQNTHDFLGVPHSDKASDLETAINDTLYEASMADAVIYMYSRTAGSADKEFLDGFYGHQITTSISPINAIGVLTKTDQLWNLHPQDSPTRQAKQVIKRNMRNPDIKRLLYTVLPVTAKAMEGFVSLTEEDWVLLDQLSNIELTRLCELLDFLPSFGDDPPEKIKYPEVRPYIGAPAGRLRLVHRLGSYGILEVVKHIKEGHSRTSISDHLYEETGIRELSDVLISHFGNRSLLIKIQYIFFHLKKRCKQVIQQTKNTRLFEICTDCLARIEHLEMNEHVFRELKVLQDYYNSAVEFKSEEELNDFLQVTGEQGRHCEARLGITRPATISEMVLVAGEKMKAWKQRKKQWGVTPQYEQAAEVIAQSYAILYYHLSVLAQG